MVVTNSIAKRIKGQLASTYILPFIALALWGIRGTLMLVPKERVLGKSSAGERTRCWWDCCPGRSLTLFRNGPSDQDPSVHVDCPG